MSLATLFFSICSLAATGVFLCAYRGCVNVYYLGGPDTIAPRFQKFCWYVVGVSFLLGCLFTVI